MAADLIPDLEAACREARRLRLQVVRKVHTDLAGAYASVFHGTGGEFQDFKPYVPGDDIRRMDWLVTARRQSPYVRRYVEERQLRVVLAVDVSLSMRNAGPGGSPWDTALRAAASLALAAAWNKDKVGALGFSSGVNLTCPPRSGERHALSVVRDLLSCRPDGPRTSPTELLRRLALVRRHAVVFLISDLATSPSLAAPEASALLASCAGRHRLIVLRTARPTPALRAPALLKVLEVESGRRRLWDTRTADLAEQLNGSWEAPRAALRRLEVPLVELAPGPDCVSRLAALLQGCQWPR